MRRMRLSFALVVALGAPAFPQKSHRELRYPPLRELRLPQVERHVLPNGMVLYLVEDHRLPIIDAAALIRVGSRHEPADKVGVAEITGAVMRTGGTASKTGDQIDEELESIAASVETSIGTTMGNASMSVLKEDIDQGLSALADVLMHPAFQEEKIELEKLQHRTAIARRNDDVGEIADREFEKLIYGAASPYARTTEYATIDHIQRADLVAFHQKYFRPNNVLMGIWGDFETAEMKAKVEKAFQDWKATPVDLPPVPEVKKEWKGSVHFIRKEDVNQTNLRLGHVGGQRNDADYHALNVMGRILGGGFSSRLFRRVRSDMGLAYAVGGGWSAEYDYPGTFRVICNTKSESTVAAAQAIQAEIRQMTAVPVTDQELRVAKDAILNSFVFNFDTTSKIVNRLLTYEYFGYPADYLQTFKANVEKVTKDDILRVAKQYLHPDRLVILAVGRDKDFDKPLNTLGPVQTLDIAIPEP
ncbi:MAG: insulinase family protein [Acidobacteria bacterium]|nr:insulinase family protein [Acidobacteriota bacterium]